MEGGRPLRYWLLAKALVRHGHDVLWWSSDFHHVVKRKRTIPTEYSFDGFRIRLVPTPRYSRNVSMRRWWSHAKFARTWRLEALEQTARGEPIPHVIIVSQPPLGLFQKAELFRSQWNCRIVLDVQDLWPEAFGQLLPAVVRPLSQVVFAPAFASARRAYRFADGVSVVSPYYVKTVQRARGESPTVFRLGRELPELPKRKNRLANELRVIYLGSLGVSYDLSTLIEAVVHCRNKGFGVSLDIAGDGELRGVVEQAANVHRPWIRYHGYVGERKLSDLLVRADVGIVPMRDDSYVAVPNKLIDYAAYGLPAIYGLTGETDLLMKKYRAGLAYVSGSVSSLCEVFRSCLGKDVSLEQMGGNARSFAKETADGRASTRALADWISTIVDRI